MVAHADSKLHGQFATEDDVEAAGAEVIQLADHHLAVDFRNMRLVFGQDASHDGAGHALALQHGFAFDIGRRTKHMRIALGTRKRLRPVAHALIHAFHGGVGNHAEDAVLQLAIKAVHHRNDGDQRRHPDRNAENGHQRNERDEMVSTFGPCIAQANEELERSEHAGNNSGSTGPE